MTKDKRIVVGIDGSERSERALRWAVYLGAKLGARVEVVTAWHYPPSAILPTEGSWDPEVAGHQMLEETVTRVIGPDAPVAKRFLAAPTAPALIAESADAELLVVGSRGHGEFVGMMLGSVSMHVATHAKCPVLIVREDDPPAH